MNEGYSFIKDTLFESIFEFAHGGISIVSTEGKWLKVNQSVLDFLGYNKAELYSSTFQDITHQDDLDIDVGLMHQLLLGQIDNYQIEKRYLHKNGYVVSALLSVSLVRLDDGAPGYFISQVTDLSQQKETSSRLNALIDIVNNQNKKLINFADIVTHDIRTHAGNLSTLTTYIEEDFNAIQTNDNFMMLKACLTNLESTLLHLNAIRSVELTHVQNIKPLLLADYVNQAIYNVSAIARFNNCKIINNVDKHLRILGIEAYLDSVILNFLTNAIKYRSEDRAPVIEINATDGSEYTVIEFKDNGLGIDLDVDAHKLFKLHETVHAHSDSRGIGLFITKKHVESMGGKIEVKSKCNEGTSFSVHFLKAASA
ncbi:PAS domain S-box protein [Lacinutrix undariae]